MININKKYLTVEYIEILCIGLLRYNVFNYNDDSVKNINICLSYFLKGKGDIYNKLLNIYETEHPIYFKIVTLLINFKNTNINLDNSIIKQKIIDNIENTIDNNTFIDAQKFISKVVEEEKLDKYNNVVIDKEFEKLLKFITVNDSISELTTLYNVFYESEDSVLKYESTLSSVFVKYENSIINNDFVIDSNEEETFQNALLESAIVQEECRSIDILNDIRIIEKKRVLIVVAGSGVGKSMFLCHAAANHLKNKKNNNKKNIIFYFTFENSKSETFLRILANITNIEIDELKRCSNDKEKIKKILLQYKKVIDKDSLLVIVELPPKRYNMLAIEAIIDRELLKYKDAIVYSVMLDYVDKMLPIDNRKTLRSDEIVGLITDDFKALTKKYDTAGLTVSQLNREGARKSKSSDEMATGADIGGGWSKYENADVVIIMQVKDTVNELGYNTVILFNEKHRYCPAGKLINCIYKPKYAKFIASSYEDGGMLKGCLSDDIENSKNKVEKISIF